MLFFDEHAGMVNTNDILPGFNPGSPANLFPTTYSYDPVAAGRPWDAPPPGGTAVTLKGMCQYTRGGLQGVDFGRKEIDTSGWN